MSSMQSDLDKMEKAYVDVVDNNINMSVPWYLMASYAYYVMDDPILSDAVFDRLAKKMIDSWEEIEHRHKHYITLDMLRGGTYLGEYPSTVEGAVKLLKEACVGKPDR